MKLFNPKLFFTLVMSILMSHKIFAMESNNPCEGFEITENSLEQTLYFDARDSMILSKPKDEYTKIDKYEFIEKYVDAEDKIREGRDKICELLELIDAKDKIIQEKDQHIQRLILETIEFKKQIDELKQQSEKKSQFKTIFGFNN